jgi:acid phosphatase (class A)
MKRIPTPAFVFALLSALVAAPPVPAQENPMQPAAPAAAVHFVKIDPVALEGILPEPPAADSLVARAELDTILEVQSARTPEQVTWAGLVDRADLFAGFGAGGLLGAQFTKANFPLLVELDAAAYADLRPMVDAAKKRFARLRPFVADPRIKPCVPLSAGNSYPSGHAYGAYLYAALLAELFPEKRDAIFDRARYFAWGRVIGGVHYPSDLEAGRRLAEFGFAELMKSAAFRAALEKCRAEAAAVALKKAA